MDRDEKRGIFFGVIGVLTLIVAIIGASLAYFSITAGSEKDALQVQAASVKIVYEDGDNLAVTDIIPSTKAIALETLRRALAKESGEDRMPYQQCIDNNKHTVCGVYEFSLTNNATSPAQLTAKIVPTEEEEATKFTNLKYALYDISDVGDASTSNGTQLVESKTITYEPFDLFPESTVTVPGEGQVKKYRLFIWLDEQEEANNEEQGASFKGTIVIDTPDSGNITGDIGD